MKKISWLLFFTNIVALCFGQDVIRVSKPDFISVQSGLAVNSYNNLSASLGFEYQKQVKDNWSLGYLFSANRAMYEFASDTKTTELNQNHLSINLYYRLSLIKEKVFWDFGVGAGVMHAYFGENLDEFGIEMNLSSTLNIKLSKRIYFQSSPLLVLVPSNRVYFSTLSVAGKDNLFAFSFLPFGVKIAL